MLSTKEIGGTLFIFLFVYFILYLDNKINIKCDCNNYQKINKISIKIPIIISVLLLIIYKIMEIHINNYFTPLTQIRHNIITDMVDF